jgi:hypothetical protein
VVDSDDRRVVQLMVKVRTARQGSIAVNLCKLDLVACDDHPVVVCGMLTKLIGELTAAGVEHGKLERSHVDLQKQLLSAQVGHGFTWILHRLTLSAS